MDTRRLACITTTATGAVKDNLEQAEQLIAEAVQKNADWILLPEMFPYMGSYDRLPEVAEPLDGPLCQRLGYLAKQHRKTIFAGIPEKPTAPRHDKKVYNSLVVFGPEGDLLHVYRKLHLFHLRFGGHTRDEGDGFIPGEGLLSFTHEGWRVACGICYDLRFPEMFVALHKKQPFDVLVLPSAFTAATGEAHWHLLLRARAVEYQAYVAAPNQTGLHTEGKTSFGHSLVIDPWGAVLADGGPAPGVTIGEISRADLGAIRKRIPMESNRRDDLF